MRGLGVEVVLSLRWWGRACSLFFSFGELRFFWVCQFVHWFTSAALWGGVLAWRESGKSKRWLDDVAGARAGEQQNVKIRQRSRSFAFQPSTAMAALPNPGHAIQWTKVPAYTTSLLSLLVLLPRPDAHNIFITNKRHRSADWISTRANGLRRVTEGLFSAVDEEGRSRQVASVERRLAR